MKQKPPLTKQHEEKRLTVSRKRIYLNKKWKRILFIDENKFNMDTSDGFSFYYHDLRQAEIINKRRQMNRNRMMIWNRIEYKGKTDVWFLEGKMNSQKYINLMRQEINEHVQRITIGKFIFEYDNDFIHRAKIVESRTIFWNKKHRFYYVLRVPLIWILSKILRED